MTDLIKEKQLMNTESNKTQNQFKEPKILTVKA